MSHIYLNLYRRTAASGPGQHLTRPLRQRDHLAPGVFGRLDGLRERHPDRPRPFRRFGRHLEAISVDGGHRSGRRVRRLENARQYSTMVDAWSSFM